MNVSTKTILALAAALALLPGAAPVHAGDISTCDTVASCNTQGTAAYKAGKWDEAIGHFENQIDFAEIAEDEKQQLVALNNLALGHLKKGEPLYAKAWLAVAQKIDAADKATVHNQGEVDKAIAALPARPAVGGTYHAYVGSGQWQMIELEPKGPAGIKNGVFKMTVLALRMGNQWREWGPAGIGELEADLTVKGNKASYAEKFEFAENPCKIDLVFAGDEMDADQSSTDMDCGFGNAVAASGEYYRVLPPFED